MKWSELTPFSKFLLLFMAVLAVLYVGYELWQGRTEPATTPHPSPLSVERAEPSVKQLLDNKNETKLVESLTDPKPSVRDGATSALWRLWHGAAGPEAERRLQAGMDMLSAGHPPAAVDQFSQIVADYPGFAEAYHQRAAAYFTMGDYERSIQDCLKATGLNKNHFAAWHLLGRCYLSIRRYDLALNAFERALELQPFSEENKRF